MIFKYTVEKVLDGTQTQARCRIGRVRRYACTRDMTYAVQTASGRVCGAKIKIKRVREQLLGAMTEADAKAEGYPNLAAFQQVWAQQYGHFDPCEDVWVIDFSLV